MAVRLNDLDRESMSQSLASDPDESDHLEVHNTFKHRGRILGRWKRLVKANSLLYLIFSSICFIHLFLFSRTQNFHSYVVCITAIFAALWGLSTGFSFGDPSSVRIYINSVITGFASAVVCIYTFVVLSVMVLQSIDQKYEEQFDNFKVNEVRLGDKYWKIKILAYLNLSFLLDLANI